MTLEAALAEIQRVRNCPAVLRLCLDCWAWAQTHGEEMGLQMAAMLLEGVSLYAAHDREVNRLASWGMPPTPPPSCNRGSGADTG